MLVDLDKSMLAALVRGMYPSYEIMDHPLIKQKGYYTGGHSDRWNWNHGFESNCTEGDLWATYELLKNPKAVEKVQEPIMGTAKYVISKLDAVEGVTFSKIEDYFDMSLAIFVSGGGDEDIAYVLYESLPICCGLKGDYIVSTTQHGFIYSYRINRV